MINYDIPWNPARLEQRMGRIHRYGQRKDCLIFNFAATNTIEGRVLQRLLEKTTSAEAKERRLVPEVIEDFFDGFARGDLRGLWSVGAAADLDLVQVIEEHERVVEAIFAFYEKRGFEPSPEEREKALKEADRRKDEFLAMLAHELRNPLGIIRAFTEDLDFTLGDAKPDEAQLNGVEAIINSMTRHERLNPQVLNASRKRRVAAGSGTSVQEINQLVKQFRDMQKLMKQMSAT